MTHCCRLKLWITPKLFVITFMYHTQKDGQEIEILLELLEIHSLLHITHSSLRFYGIDWRN
jgi:hypothetical protein